MNTQINAEMARSHADELARAARAPRTGIQTSARRLASSLRRFSA
jgi:hypothetical protein